VKRGNLLDYMTGERRAKSRFPAPELPPAAPLRSARHKTADTARHPPESKPAPAPEIAKKFANTCQHFGCQNTVSMCQDEKTQNRLI